MCTIAEFEVPSVFTVCRLVGHDGRIEVLRVVTAATCSKRKIGKFKIVDFHNNNNNVYFVHFVTCIYFKNPQGIILQLVMCRRNGDFCVIRVQKLDHGCTFSAVECINLYHVL